ncbi:antibiotic biosynthesis monooxygenase family protein [Frondihabitans australicus]|uniref:Heme-degrading monooxygenase HmoA n=1 Tax=Frondihabitans australicus TaxID=386892 RepID=A0A495ILP8_9MICO|nr:heme-degrading monooxygenase HmoA [Frondihabitans australicus]
MSVVKINAIHVPEGHGAELEKRFAARKHAVDSADGFEGFQLLRPVKGDERYFVVTTWKDEESFQAWAADGAKAAHAAPSGAHAAPSGAHAAAPHHGGQHGDGPAPSDEHHGGAGAQRPVATGADLLEFEVVEL